MTDTRVKICGLTRPEDLVAVEMARVTYGGFVFFPKSPRNLTPEAARALAVDAPVGLAKVALVVNADNDFLDAITDVVPLDMLQLQGSETPERVAEIRDRYGLPVMKAIGIGSAEDLPQIDRYAPVVDQLLVDTKPPKDAKLPGGNGVRFDWSLLQGRRWPRPWMLAGGLTKDNVAEAIRVTGALQVDVSSAVEAAPGVKDATKIATFAQAARDGAQVPRLV